jgi:hypothetical protein
MEPAAGGMLPAASRAHFEAFGFVVVRGCFGAAETVEIRAAADELWGRGLAGAGFAEQHPRLAALAGDARVLGPAAQLLGPDFVWAGSEGNVSAVTIFGWHADRKYWGPPAEAGHAPAAGWPQACGPGAPQRDLSLTSFRQLKMSLYLDALGAAGGCFRVVPGSHRAPLFGELGPQETFGNKWGAGPHRDPPFGVEAAALPHHAVETRPGDLIIWHSCLWHGVYAPSRESLPLQPGGRCGPASHRRRRRPPPPPSATRSERRSTPWMRRGGRRPARQVHPSHCRPAFRLHVPSHFHHQPTKRANHLVTHSDGHQRQQP